VTGGLYFGTTNMYVHYDSGSSELRIVGDGNKILSMTTGGGHLHGTWASEGIISASDRRLKRRIEPLHKALAARTPSSDLPRNASWQPASDTDAQQSAAGAGGASRPASAQNGSSEGMATGPLGERLGTVDWLLRQLRPVSFNFRRGPEAKYERYGFVAQEVEKILPDIVRTQKDSKFVVYQDMVAILTLASQVQQERLLQQERRAGQRAVRLDAQAKRLSRLKRGVSALSARMSRWEAMAGRRLKKIRSRQS